MYGYLPPPHTNTYRSHKMYTPVGYNIIIVMLSKDLKLADDATLPKEVKHYIDKSSKWNALL